MSAPEDDTPERPGAMYDAARAALLDSALLESARRDGRDGSARRGSDALSRLADSIAGENAPGGADRDGGGDDGPDARREGQA